MSTIGVGVIGTGWMARAHSHALRAIADLGTGLPPVRLVRIGGRDAGRADHAARRLGFDGATADWRDVVHDPGVSVVVDAAANALHAEPSLAALGTGKHVVCEKPLATTLADADRLAVAAGSSPGQVAVCSYNYRFVPALRLARVLIGSGRLGTLRQLRAGYLQDWAGDTANRHGWRFDRAAEGNSVADYSHIIDLTRWLVGEPVAVCGLVGTLDPATAGLRPARIGSDHEDWYAATLRTDSGVLVSLEASRVATGWKGRQYLELVGARGTVTWDMEDLNRLRVYLRDDETGGPAEIAGFRDVLVTEPAHPFLRYWWAPGHGLGWEHTLVHEWIAILAAVADLPGQVDDLPTFADGRQACRVVEAIRASSAAGGWQAVPAFLEVGDD